MPLFSTYLQQYQCRYSRIRVSSTTIMSARQLRQLLMYSQTHYHQFIESIHQTRPCLICRYCLHMCICELFNPRRQLISTAARISPTTCRKMEPGIHTWGNKFVSCLKRYISPRQHHQHPNLPSVRGSFRRGSLFLRGQPSALVTSSNPNRTQRGQSRNISYYIDKIFIRFGEVGRQVKE